MAVDKSLNNITVVNTRPAHQSEALTKRIESYSGQVIEVPLFFIQAETKQAIEKKIDTTPKPDILIFVSANAAHTLLPHYTPEKNTTIIAIGPSTAQAIQHYGIRVDAMPLEYNSQGILALQELSNVCNKTIFISCGYESRDELKPKLIAREATVILLESYCRVFLPPDETALPSLINQSIDAIIITSLASLTYLRKAFFPKHTTWLYQQQLLVITTEQAKIASSMGFKKIPWICHNASIKSIVDCLLIHANSDH